MTEGRLDSASRRHRYLPGRPRRLLPPLTSGERQQLEAIRARFAARIRVDERTGCWIWIAGRQTAQGYGGLKIGGRAWLAHRLWRGPIPAGLCVLHRCDTPPCIRPDHLFLGTRVDNALDARNKRLDIIGRGWQRLGEWQSQGPKVAKRNTER